MITITNKKNTLELVFNEYATAFAASRVSIEKGAGNRIYLSPDKTYIEIIYAADGEKVNVNAGNNFVFDSGGGVPFPTMESLYEKLIFFMEDREGAA